MQRRKLCNYSFFLIYVSRNHRQKDKVGYLLGTSVDYRDMGFLRTYRINGLSIGRLHCMRAICHGLQTEQLYYLNCLRSLPCTVTCTVCTIPPTVPFPRPVPTYNRHNWVVRDSFSNGLHSDIKKKKQVILTRCCFD